MRPHHIIVYQNPEKSELAPFFYSQLLKLPGEATISEKTMRWFREPVFLICQVADPEEFEKAPWGKFTGIQLNVVPANGLNPIVAGLRATGINQPAPHDRGAHRLMMAHDPSGNTVMLVGMDEPPDEPVVDRCIGSVSVFVSDVVAARRFFVDGLGLPLRAEPFPGLIVLGVEGGTSILVYQVPEDSPQTPIGRETGLTLVDPDPELILERLEQFGGKVVHAAQPYDDEGLINMASIADPDGNTFNLLAEIYVAGI